MKGIDEAMTMLREFGYGLFLFMLVASVWAVAWSQQLDHSANPGYMPAAPEATVSLTAMRQANYAADHESDVVAEPN